MKKIFSLLLFLFITAMNFAQNINQFDADGKRHGIWKKHFEGTEVLRYEGEFLHGKEIGVFKYYKNYKNKALLSATKEFNKENNISNVKFFGRKNKLISEGQMDGRIYIGPWKYYQKGSNGILTTENFDEKGQLVGERLVYYPNGNIAEKENYVDGKLDGATTLYSKTNAILKEFVYVKGVLHGLTKLYTPEGDLQVEGQYKKGKKDGIWKYYRDGKVVKKEDFTYQPKFLKKDGKYIKNPKYKAPTKKS